MAVTNKTQFLDLSRVSYSMTTSISKKRYSVEVGFTTLDDAQQFHQWIAQRSKEHQRMTPLARAEAQARKLLSDLATEMSHVATLPAELREAIVQIFVKLVVERNEQGRNAVELFDECRRLRDQLAKAEAVSL